MRDIARQPRRKKLTRQFFWFFPARDHRLTMSADLRPGMHLTSRRRGYVHHGLYAGDGRVIHYAGYDRRFRCGPVEEVTLEQFAGGRGWQVKPWTAPTYTGRSAVERARARLGENRYRIWSNNCEHLVEWAIGGTPRSAQVDAWTERVRGGLAWVAAPWTTRPEGRWSTR